ncbi:RagB/SusD family nutrient uptake outer membrane protein [Dyadobacter psychrotolerans]|uniref:RagB/SusD family nutrient uptake outer membrane protein n=1 Tax=Dyadobacter psychrotolerans TaxID=2541721 RepID=A0A4R5DU47_9BACT|nr:RagB/SusD family nutrient uptake outer membrane protein [Dyadobacter psychrotolerans]TDE18056.1 RagB/SusD family nutrient uptake outer membrane protein [Dyadobacter psychrotolerans]
MKKTNSLIYPFLVGFLLLTGCKGDFLEEKPQKSLLVPTTLTDFQALLDNGQALMNTAPYQSILSDGDFQMSESFFAGQSQLNQNSYIWADQPEMTLPGWDTPYRQVFTCNVVLDGLAKLDKDLWHTPQYESVKGSALFFRAFAFYQLAQLFSPAYQPGSEGIGLGIPLPLQADVNLKHPRSSVRQTYERILDDLMQAEPLLPLKPVYISSPGKPAALALLARTTLSMQDYPGALSYAEKCLALKSELLDYATLAAASAVPFPHPFALGNPEMLFYSRMAVSYFENPAFTVDTTLYASYASGDLRKPLYFGTGLNYKGSYTSNQYPFAGLSTDETYLIKAECLARTGQSQAAMKTLNAMLEKRWAKNSFKELTAGSPEQALKLILAERRKELVGRGMRWADLKRLNQDPQFAQVLTRTIQKKIYTLPPGGERYQFKIPDDQTYEGTVVQNP